MIELIHGDCLEKLKDLPDNSVDSIVTDPPYGLSFMGKKWDYDVPTEAVWRECLRVLKPGGHLLAFAGTRTQHRMAVRIEDAGFEIRDMIAWVYGSGFPKSLNIGKAVDKNNGEAGRLLKFTLWMRTTGLKSAQVKAVLLKAGLITERSNTAGHYFAANLSSQPSIPTVAMWKVVRPLVSDVPKWVDELVERIEAEREIIGQKTSGIANSAERQRHTIGASKSVVVDITVPATEAAKQWEGWGTALKPALEPITVARKPLIGTVAENVLTHGTGGINIDQCRVPSDGSHMVKGIVTKQTTVTGDEREGKALGMYGAGASFTPTNHEGGRFPANLIHDGSEETISLFPGEADKSAARFFYAAKASKKDREEGCERLEARSAGEVTGGREEGSAGLNSPRAGAGRTSGSKNFHPTVKPTDLMRYLCRLVTPPGGTVLDPFMGSGSTGKAAVKEGFNFIGIELDVDYFTIAKQRIGV